MDHNEYPDNPFRDQAYNRKGYRRTGFLGAFFYSVIGAVIGSLLVIGFLPQLVQMGL
jgi:hypothetical protein